MRSFLRRASALALILAAAVPLAGQQQPSGPAYTTTPAPPRPDPGAPTPIPRIPPMPTPRPPADIEPIIVPPARIRPWREGAVQLQTVRVSVAIDEQVATTSLELTLWNPAGRAQEAQLILPVPDGVTIRSFQYDGTGPEPTAVLLPRDEARRIYDSIVHRSRDPGLLEFAGYNAIKTSVFPVPAGARQAVRLVYEQILPADLGRVDYFLPRSEALGSTGVTWTISATIKSSRAIATVYSPSHEVAVDRQGAGTVSVRVPERAAGTPGAFRLCYVVGGAGAAAGSPEIPATILAYPDPSVAGGQGGYFLLLGGLPSVPPQANPTKREITLVIDRSGSMRGQKIDQAKAAALQVVEGLRNGESFNIIDFSDSISSFAPAAVIKTDQTAADARKYIAAIEANGGTALHDALMEALRPRPGDGLLPMVLFLTDGLPTIGEKNEVKIRENAAAANAFNRRVFTFGVGVDVNTPLLAAVSKASRGAATFVLPGEDVEVAVSQVFRRLTGPVFAAPRLIAVGPDGRPTSAVRELMPGTLPDYFDGDQVVILGQYTGAGKIRLRLEGDFLGKPGSSFEYTLDPANASARNGFVPRLWATRKIAALIEEIRQGSANPRRPENDPRMKELVDEIVRLSTRFGILTEYTSFLATDEQGRRADGGGAAVPAGMAPARARESFAIRGDDRSGAGSVNQEQNIKQMSEQMAQSKTNVYLGTDLKDVQLNTVQLVDTIALYQRGGNRWVDSRILADADKDPERTIEFGTPEYDQAIEAMSRENLLWTLTNKGDLYLLLEGKRTLLKAP